MFDFLNKKKALTRRSLSIKNSLSDNYLGERLVTTKTYKRINLIANIPEPVGIIKIIDWKINIGRLVYVVNYDEKTALLSDIDFYDMSYIDDGIGSLVISYFEDILNGKNIGTISGNICDNDLNHHGDRLLYFYTKHGYTISDINVEEGFVYKITKEL